MNWKSKELKCRSSSTSLNASFHPGNAALQLLMHLPRVSVMNVAVTGQHPLEPIVEKFFHRAYLLGPRKPGDAAKRSQCLPIRRSREVIAREQKLVSIKIDDMTASMTWSGDHE